jgi:cation:H+ antiporter
MTPALAAPLFVVSVVLMLATAASFARRLDQIGLRLGLPEALLGLLTALAADAPEIGSAIVALVQGERSVAAGVVVGSNAFNLAAMLGLSAIVAARIRARHETLVLEGFVGLWVTVVACGLVAHVIGAYATLTLAAIVVVPYVALLAAGPHRVRALPIGVDLSRFVHRSLGEPHRAARPRPSRREALELPLLMAAAALVIALGSLGAVETAVDLANAWSVPHALVGVFVLAILTSLPNATTALRFGTQHRGSALMSETLNSNSINLVAGIVVPAIVVGLGSLSALAVFDVAWVLLMTATAVSLFARREGAGRGSGGILIALYAVFALVQLVVLA